MKLIENGLVLREVKTGESDRILTLLTPGHGIISVMAKGSMRPKSKLFSASGLFCFSEWTLREGKNMYWAEEAAPIEVFFLLREDIVSIALGTYIAELLQIFSPTGQEAASLLSLALNSLYLLSKKKRPPVFVKTVFELRSMAESGFLLDLDGCGFCGNETGSYFLDIGQGDLYCCDCAQKKGRMPNLDASAFMALRHVMTDSQKTVFNFVLSETNMNRLSQISESFLLFHLDYPPKSLNFLKTLL